MYGAASGDDDKVLEVHSFQIDHKSKFFTILNPSYATS